MGLAQPKAPGTPAGPSTATQWTAAAPADVQQDGAGTVAGAAVTLTGSPSVDSYAWVLTAPDGSDQTALLGDSTAANHGGIADPTNAGACYPAGIWLASCTVTVGSDTQTVTQRIQVGNDQGLILVDLSSGTTTTDSLGVIDATSSFGETSTVVIDNNVGEAEKLTAGFVTKQVAASVPAGVIGIRCGVEATPPATNPHPSGSIDVAAMVSTVVAPAAANNGFRAGLSVDSANNFEPAKGMGLGTAHSNGVALTGPSGYCEIQAAYDAAIPKWWGVQWAAYGSGGGADAQNFNMGQSASVGAVHVGLSIAQTSSTGDASTSTFTGVKLWWGFVFGPTL